MSDDQVSFEVSDEVRAKYPEMSQLIGDLTEGLLAELVSMGVPLHHAGSVIANMMLRDAWLTAALCKLEAGQGQPDPGRFLTAAQAAISSVKFRERGEDASVGPMA